MLLTAIFVDAALGGAGLADGRNMANQLAIQITGLVVVLLWSLVLSYVIAKAVQASSACASAATLRSRASICASTANAATTYNTAGVG